MLLLDGLGLALDDVIQVCAARRRAKASKKAVRVEHSRRYAWLRSLVCGLLPTVALVVGFGRQSEGATASASPAVVLDDHSQFCKCRDCSGAPCCCGPHRAETVGSPAVPTNRPVWLGGTCLSPTPCDGSQVPNTPVPGPSGKMATLAAGSHVAPVTDGRFLPSQAHCILPAPRASQLDDPPESPPVA
jgi:hypothetical protein